eukprot:CAMPEP_0183739714 /NCGR_PEP_ID=MMETSP0737-20130205/57774_1 /TAXON_ID=385413 /ORGANISM="Thalassiosira miniscula, Strain CCMP1093" /LENGTH=287 /DNA_ID=CAMNT_0025974579 /DNA_START=100 /DNA_END=963 /DNA_ORIENTATION=+
MLTNTNSFQDDDLIFGDPLRLGDMDVDAECFEDFNFDDGARILTESQVAECSECLMSPEMSSYLDCMVPSEDHTMGLGSIQGQENKLQMSCKNNSNRDTRTKRRRHNSRKTKLSSSMNCIQMTSNLDRAPVKREQYQRTSSFNDIISMDTSSKIFDSRAARGTHIYPEDSYNEALQKLADSMKRTEQSRQQLILQRAAIDAPTPSQQHSLQQVVAPAQQQLNQCVRDVPVAPAHCISAEPTSQHPINDRSSIMAAFFSGSRGTLTNGLENSRRQLKMYMDQMGNQTL